MRELFFPPLTSDDLPLTVGGYFARHFPLSSRLLAELKRTDGIRRNGLPVTVRVPLCAGDVLSLAIVDEAPSEGIVPEDLPLSILYEDQDILAVNKPKDMPVHPSMYHYTGTLGNAVAYRYQNRNEPFVFRPITRLDRDTTGVVLIARNRLAAQLLSEQMQKGTIEKTYYARLAKTPDSPAGTVHAPIGRVGDSVIKREVRPDGKDAVTDYTVKSVFSDGTCVAEIHPRTGRTHQIRVHMAHIGCPLLYDYLYGTESAGKTLYLHCRRLHVVHPFTGESLTLSAPLPSEGFSTAPEEPFGDTTVQNAE